MEVFHDDTLQKPGVINRMNGRENHEMNTPEDYFRVACFLPCSIL